MIELHHFMSEGMTHFDYKYGQNYIAYFDYIYVQNGNESCVEDM